MSAFSVGPNGALTPISGSPFSTGGIGGNGGYVASTNILVSPSGNILFVANTGSNDVSAFSINPNTGTLTLVPGSPFSTGGNGNLGLALSATPDGKFLMVGNTISANITVFSIAPNGSLTPIAGSPFTAPSYLTGTKVSPNGSWDLAASVSGGVAMFGIGTHGTLTEVPGSPFSTAGYASGVDINCSSTFLFAGSTTTTIDVFSIAGSGVLTPIPGSPFSPGVGIDSAAVVLLSPSDNDLFVTDDIGNSVTVLSVLPDGSLTLVPGSPFAEPSGNSPTGMATNQAGTFLYTGNIVGVDDPTSSVGAFSVADNGSLALVPGSPFPIPGFSFSVAAFPPKSCALSRRFLSFPLQNRNAFDAKIVSVFDHSSNWQYCADGVVEAYDGETGELEYGTDNHPTDPTCHLTGWPNLAYAFAKNNKTPFNVNGQYVGVNGDGLTKYLQYDGHPGFDFETKDQSKDGKIPVLAAADGTVVCSNVPVPAKCADNTTIDPCIEGPGEIEIKHSNGYFSIYLHLSSSSVTAGETGPLATTDRNFRRHRCLRQPATYTLR